MPTSAAPTRLDRLEFMILKHIAPFGGCGCHLAAIYVGDDVAAALQAATVVDIGCFLNTYKTGYVRRSMSRIAVK